MKIILKTFLLASVVSLCLLCVPVKAESPPAAPAEGSTSAQRLEQRKRERTIQLAERDSQRLSQRCVASQTKVRQLQRPSAALFDSRANLYKRIDATTWIVIGQLKLADKDTFELEKQRSALAEKTQAFQTTAAHYLQTLDDIAVINCQADVVGFKALVETARLYHTDLRTRSTDIRTYIVDTLKPTLREHSSDLQPKTNQDNS